MAGKLVRPRQPGDIHRAATLWAAGVPFNGIRTKHNLSAAALRNIMADPEWPSILQSKRNAINALMRGDA